MIDEKEVQENTSRILQNLPKDKILVFVMKPEVKVDVFDYLEIRRL